MKLGGTAALSLSKGAAQFGASFFDIDPSGDR
jgi:hypothetical protein